MKRRSATALIAALAGALLWTSRAPPARAAEAVARCTEAAEDGQRLRASGQLRAASQKMTVCIAPECPALVRRHCAKWREELDDAIPTIVVRVVDARGHDVQTGKIRVDGAEEAEPGDGRAIAIDPGSHTIAWTRGEQRVAEDVVVREGERNRAVVLTLGAAADPGPDRGGTTAPPRPLDPVPPAPSGSTPWPAVLAGAGAAVGIGGGVFWYLGTRDHAHLESTCAATSSCAPSDVSHAKTELVVGDVLVGISVAAISTAVVWFLLRDAAPRRPVAWRTVDRTWPRASRTGPWVNDQDRE